MGYKVVFEIETDDNNGEQSPLEAAKMVQQWLQERGNDWQYYVQDEYTDEIFSVDLSEEDEDAVLPVDKYEPLIK